MAGRAEVAVLGSGIGWSSWCREPWRASRARSGIRRRSAWPRPEPKSSSDPTVPLVERATVNGAERSPSRGQLLDAAFRTAVEHLDHRKYGSEEAACAIPPTPSPRVHAEAASERPAKGDRSARERGGSHRPLRSALRCWAGREGLDRLPLCRPCPSAAMSWLPPLDLPLGDRVGPLLAPLEMRLRSRESALAAYDLDLCSSPPSAARFHRSRNCSSVIWTHEVAGVAVSSLTFIKTSSDRGSP